MDSELATIQAQRYSHSQGSCLSTELTENINQQLCQAQAVLNVRVIHSH